MANTDIAQPPTGAIVGSSLPALSPSRLEAWDRCPRAYRFEYVDRLPRSQADEYPLLLGLACHALLEAYVREALARGQPPRRRRLARSPGRSMPAARCPPRPRASIEMRRRCSCRGSAARPSRWTASRASRMALAMSWDGRAAEWRDPTVGIRGRLDLLVVENRAATIQDWKSGWVAESQERLETAWAPGLYAALLWAAAPRLEAISVEYHYLRTAQVSRVRVSRDMAAETLAWARTTATMIGESSTRRRERSRRVPSSPQQGVHHLPVGEPLPGRPGGSRDDQGGRHRRRGGSRPAGRVPARRRSHALQAPRSSKVLPGNTRAHRGERLRARVLSDEGSLPRGGGRWRARGARRVSPGGHARGRARARAALQAPSRARA